MIASKNFSWHRFRCQFIKDLRLWVYLILLFQYFHILFSIRFFPVSFEFPTQSLTSTALLDASTAISAINYLGALMRTGVFDVLIAGLFILPFSLLVSFPSLFINIERSARFLRKAYTLKLGIVIILIHALYYLNLALAQDSQTVYQCLSWFKLALFSETNWIDWLSVIAMIAVTLGFTWFSVIPWVNRGAYVAIKPRGLHQILLSLTEGMIVLLTFVIYLVMLIFVMNNLDFLYLSDTSFIRYRLINPIGAFLYELMTCFYSCL